MSSIVESTLNAVEYGRQNCIKNAKLANLPATQSMDVYSLGNLFLQQNNTEYVDPIPEHWQRPVDWIDIDTVLENAPVHEGYKPIYVLLMSDEYGDTTLLSKSTTNYETWGDAFYTSDGHWYVGDTTHTWDTTQDVPCSLGYKTRYVIVYTTDSTSQITGTMLSSFPFLEILFNDNITFGTKNYPIYFTCSSSPYNANQYVVSVRAKSTVTSINLNLYNGSKILYGIKYISFPGVTGMIYSNDSLRLYALNLEDFDLSGLTAISSEQSNFTFFCCTNPHITLPNVTTIYGNNGHSSPIPVVDFRQARYVDFPKLTNWDVAFRNSTHTRAVQLRDVQTLKLPLVTSLPSGAFSGLNMLKSIDVHSTTSIGAYAFGGCPIEEINTPLVTSVGSNAFGGCYCLRSISLPVCSTIGTYAFQNCSQLSSVSIPLCTTLGSYAFNGCSSLESISLACAVIDTYTFSKCTRLKSIALPACTTINENAFQNCYSLEEFEFPSTVTAVASNAFNTCTGLKKLTLYNDWDISGLDLSTCVSLTPGSLNDILDKLKNVANLGVTRTLVLGTQNLAKLTAEQIAVGTNKGWTIS